LAVFGAGIASLKFVDWDRQKPFLRSYAGLHVGMSMRDVHQVFRRQFRGQLPDCGVHYNGRDVTGPIPSPELAEAGENFTGAETYCADPSDGGLNAETITVSYVDGRVSELAYSPD
jgi:hypothetical protein